MEVLSNLIVPATLSIAIFNRYPDKFQNPRGNGIVEATIFFILWVSIAFVNHTIENLIVKGWVISVEIVAALNLLTELWFNNLKY
jgi:hypothetical protein